MSLSLAIYCLKLSLTISLLKGSSKMLLKLLCIMITVEGQQNDNKWIRKDVGQYKIHLRSDRYILDRNQIFSCITMSLSLAIYCLKLSLTISLLKGSRKMLFKEEALQYRISGHNTFWNSIKILKYLKEWIIAKSSSTTYHGNVSLLQCSNETTVGCGRWIFKRKLLFKVFQNFNSKSESVVCSFQNISHVDFILHNWAIYFTISVIGKMSLKHFLIFN